MPIDYKDYPPNWNVIRRVILARADERCECLGECGRDHGQEYFEAGFMQYWKDKRCQELNGQEHSITESRVVLTIAHLGIDKDDGSPGDKHDKLDSRPANLKAMCQRCHLAFDIEDHVRNRAANKRKAQVAAGQTEMKL